MQVIVRVPATSANLGPGFDCLGLALDLWNETSFSLTGQGLSINVEGEGEGKLSLDHSNLIVQAAQHYYSFVGQELPTDITIHCQNHIPLSSGLGSSAAAVLTGLLGANALAGNLLSQEEVLNLAIELEGHPDNVAPALHGGLSLSAPDGKANISKQINVHPFQIAIVLPEVKLSTQDARNALPPSVGMSDAVFNLSHTTLTVEALRNGDLELLSQAMQDRLHQPYRLPLIPGAAEAIQAAQNTGAAAALSGAGPSVIAFAEGNVDAVAERMQSAFTDKGIASRKFTLGIAAKGATIKQT
ncbi:MAG: homoserine kinase [Chloroflexi bacterium]|nr:homoserine kinase [Chloroflexota bacterium]NOH12198.1 homoserine kinase [Chloroflexota bacterium]